jgi:hypothetical protein
MNTQFIEFNMSADYCADWTAIEALREIVQNALDSGEEWECHIEDDVISVLTNNAVIQPESFALGQSSKSDGRSIGKYGEGFKIAMLVLTRARRNPTIHTAGVKVTGLFKTHEFTGLESFCLAVEACEYSEDTLFTCDVGGTDIALLKERVTAFSDEPIGSTQGVDLLQDRPGKVYVNGLYVCDTDFTFGYNFAPHCIVLNRDRNMMNGAAFQVANYYAGLKGHNADLLFNLLEADAADVQDLKYYDLKPCMEAELTRLFYNKYGNGAKISKPGTSYIGGCSSVSCNATASKVYASCGIEEAKRTVDPEAPHAVLEAFVKAHKSKLRRDTKKQLTALIVRAKGWSKADVF